MGLRKYGISPQHSKNQKKRQKCEDLKDFFRIGVLYLLPCVFSNQEVSGSLYVRSEAEVGLPVRSDGEGGKHIEEFSV
jgi:hypothetical protein